MLDMTRPPLTQTLTKTIELGVDVIERRRRLYHTEQIAELECELELARKRLIEGGNPIGRDTVFFVAALKEIDGARVAFDRKREETWRSIARLLLDAVRAALYDAMLAENKRPTP